MSELQRRSEALLRQRGYLTASVEKRKRFPAPKSKPCKVCGLAQMIDIASDLWNVFDLIAIRPFGAGLPSGGVPPIPNILFVQVTSASNHAGRRNKIIASSEAKLCLLAGASILIQSWRKKENRWQYMDEWISLDQFVFGLPDTVEQFYEDQRRQKLLAREPGYTLPLSDGLKDSEIPF